MRLSRDPEGVGGWLLVYLAGSLPLMVMCAVGLSGWFLDYPLLLAVAIFCVLATPLVLIAIRSAQAPRWNVAVLWIMAVLMALRAVNVFVLPLGGETQGPPQGEEILGVATTLAAIVSVLFAWAALWTRYFRQSGRIRRTFPAHLHATDE